MNPAEQLKTVSAYYGKTLQTSSDLKTSACCTSDAVPDAHRAILATLHPEVTSRFYGCGSPIPELLSGCTVLDLGCGTGRDVYLASALVGPTGRVIGVDMTDEQLTVARAHTQFHAHAFFGPAATSNVQFRKGFIEDLHSADIDDHSVDVVISNCVCNLSPDKNAVFSEVARVLKPGGEFYFSDVYADRRLSTQARSNDVLVAECLGGALYVEDFRRHMAKVGFKDIRVVSAGPIELHDTKLKPLVEDVTFYSITIRAFNVPGLEDRRENYGQVATYTSSCGSGLKLDIDNHFQKNVPRPVDANTAAILQASRFSANFSVTPRGPHQGLFSEKLTSVAVGSVIDCFRPTAKTSVPASLESANPSSRAPASTCCPSISRAENSTAERASGKPASCVSDVTIHATDKADTRPTAESGRGTRSSGCC